MHPQQATTASRTANTVILINPSLLKFKKSSKIVHFPIPYNLLCLAHALLENGFGAEIINFNVTPEFNPAATDILALAMSVSTSNQISHAIKLTRELKARYPGVPVIWGGPHPTAVPLETIKSGHPDAIIIGEGEATLVEFARAIKNGLEPDTIPGLMTRAHAEGRLQFAERPLIDINRPVLLPYDLIDLGIYRTTEMLYQSSRGCVFKCSFCYNTSFPDGRNPYRAKSPDVVIQELKHLVRETSPKMLFIVDDDFLTERRRTLEIARRIREAGLGITWKAFASVCHVLRFTPSELLELKESGCGHLYLGAETLNPRIMSEFLSKQHTPEMIIEATRMLRDAGIIPILGFLTGFLDEEEKEINNAIDFTSRIKAIYPQATIRFLGLVVPLPGTEYYRRVIERGFVVPKTLEEWAEGFDSLTKRMCAPEYGGWLSKRFRNRVDTAEMILDFIYYYDFALSMALSRRQGRRSRVQYFLFLAVFAPLYPIANLQLRRKWFGIPLLGLIFKFVRRRFDANFE